MLAGAGRWLAHAGVARVRQERVSTARRGAMHVVPSIPPNRDSVKGHGRGVDPRPSLALLRPVVRRVTLSPVISGSRKAVRCGRALPAVGRAHPVKCNRQRAYLPPRGDAAAPPRRGGRRERGFIRRPEGPTCPPPRPASPPAPPLTPPGPPPPAAGPRA